MRARCTASAVPQLPAPITPIRCGRPLRRCRHVRLAGRAAVRCPLQPREIGPMPLHDERARRRARRPRPAPATGVIHASGGSSDGRDHGPERDVSRQPHHDDEDCRRQWRSRPAPGSRTPRRRSPRPCRRGTAARPDRCARRSLRRRRRPARAAPAQPRREQDARALGHVEQRRPAPPQPGRRSDTRWPRRRCRCRHGAGRCPSCGWRPDSRAAAIQCRSRRAGRSVSMSQRANGAASTVLASSV